MRFFVFFLVFILSVDCWAACISVNSEISLGSQVFQMVQDPRCTGSNKYGNAASVESFCGSVSCPSTKAQSGFYFAALTPLGGGSCRGSGFSCDPPKLSFGSSCYADASYTCGSVQCIAHARCGSQCEADSVACVFEGKTWYPGLNGQCGSCSDDDLCSDSRSECESMNGVFSGSANSGCCVATCNQCAKLDDLVEQKRKMCCDQGLAPPDKARQCRVEARGTCGMNWSTYLSNDNEFSCQNPSISAEASSRYASECSDKSSSSGGGSSSSGGGSSSSGGGSSSSGNDSQCMECPYLDSILDTLIAQKGIVSDIYKCLTVPGQCGTSSKDSLSIPPWVAEKFDSTLDNQKKEIRELGIIDTSLLKLLDSVHLVLKNDTLTRKTIMGVGTSIDSSIGAASDTSKKILRHIAEIMQVNELEFAKHIDSIISKLPDSVLDSIIKYQKYAIDNFDSAFWGAGNGFQKIDDLTDSAIKYFKQGFHYDSVYSSVYRDSLGEIHEAINSLSTSIGYALGYGDTATSTLRGDIEALSGKFDAASIDTGAVGYGSGFVAEGERFGDSLARAVGWLGGLDGVDHDSIFRAAGFDSIAVDSVGRAVDDSLNLLADSLNNILVAQNDSIKNNLPSTLDAYSDSLIAYSPFASFDSLIFGQLGAKIPNSNQCPDDCNKWSITLPRFGLFNFTIDYGLCLGRVPLGGMNVLGFIRLLLRIVVVWSCIWIVFNALTRRKD